MKKNIKILVWPLVLFLICNCGVFFGGYYYSQSTTGKEIEKVINRNTHTIQSLAVTAKTDSNNSDILLEILKALNGEPTKELPKNINGLFLSDKPEFALEDGDEDLPVTFNQIYMDQREIELGIRSFASANLFQGNTLHTILNKIKTQQENQKNTDSP